MEKNFTLAIALMVLIYIGWFKFIAEPKKEALENQKAQVEETLVKENIDTSKLFIAYCPERVLPGQIMRELVENDRIVGGTTAEATQKTVEFYNTFVSGEVLSTDASVILPKINTQ